MEELLSKERLDELERDWKTIERGGYEQAFTARTRAPQVLTLIAMAKRGVALEDMFREWVDLFWVGDGWCEWCEEPIPNHADGCIVDRAKELLAGVVA